MTIRNKLILRFTIVVALLLIVFSAAIYYFSSFSRDKDFYHRLKNKALTTARLLTEIDEVDETLLKTIDKNTIHALHENRVVVINSSNKEIYNSTDSKPFPISSELLSKIRKDNEAEFKFGSILVKGIIYQVKNDYVVVIASAIDSDGDKILSDLKIILLIGLFVSILITIFIGRLFSSQAINPILNVITEIKLTTINNLNEKIDIGNGKDEIAQLAIEFNKMMERLDDSFEMQRDFVSNVSHELRTPITAIGGQIEIALMKKRNIEEYQILLKSLWEDIRNFGKLSNGLLDLAQASIDSSKIRFRELRIDEVLWQSSDELLKHHQDYNIKIEYQELDGDEDKLRILGNENLLKTAIINVIDNACKYSENKKVSVSIGFNNKYVALQFVDSGIGISDEDQKLVFKSFYRAGNAKSISGHGIGLALTEKIIKLHSGEINLSSVLNKGTTITILLQTIY
jgi:signal transduction histidine kinase